MNNNTNIAAWMIGAGLTAEDPTDDRNFAHLRALKASRSPSSSLVSRLAAAVAAIRPTAAPADPDCCPA